jgi:lipopolysaccharide/colanic/teichoic acid biosynthesis glycosyltransferase
MCCSLAVVVAVLVLVVMVLVVVVALVDTKQPVLFLTQTQVMQSL